MPCGNRARPVAANANQLVAVLAATTLVALATSRPAHLHAQVEYTLLPEVRMGALDGPAALTYVWSVKVDLRGWVYISQPQDRQVVVFDSVGMVRRRIGREGGGPGEFRGVGAVSLRNDTVWIPDPIQRRISAFTRDGTHLRTITWGRSPAYPAGVYADGSFHAGYMGEQPMDDNGRRRFTRYDSAGTELGVMAFGSPGTVDQIGFDGTFWVRPPRFFDSSLFVRIAHDSLLVIVDRRATAAAERRRLFSLTWVNLLGDTILRREYQYTPQPIDRDEVQRAATMMLARTRHASNGAARRVVEDELRRTTHVPPVAEIAAGTDGSVWIIRAGALGESLRAERIDRNGEIIGYCQLRPGTRLMAATAEHLYILERDRLGVESVVRYRYSAERRPVP